MDPIRFTAHGVPKPQPRARGVNRGAHAGVYDPGTAAEWKAIVCREARPVRPASPLPGALRVAMAFVFARPAGHYGKRGNVLPSKPAHHTMNRFDPDNLAKAVLDVLTQDGWWKDDGYVIDLHVTKCWGDIRTQGVTVEVEDVSAVDFQDRTKAIDQVAPRPSAPAEMPLFGEVGRG